MMRLLKGTMILVFLGWIAMAASLARAQEKVNREIRPASQMSGIIIAPLESGKQILTAGDKFIVGLAKKFEVKPGDHLEIFNPPPGGQKESLDPFFQRIGLAVFLEKIGEKSILCIIDHSAKEVSVGDWVYLLPSR
jgi:hypothetical protein